MCGLGEVTVTVICRPDVLAGEPCTVPVPLSTRLEHPSKHPTNEPQTPNVKGRRNADARGEIIGT